MMICPTLVKGNSKSYSFLYFVNDKVRDIWTLNTNFIHVIVFDTTIKNNRSPNEEINVTMLDISFEMRGESKTKQQWIIRLFTVPRNAPFHPMHLFFHTPLTVCHMKTWGCEWYTSSLLRNKGIDVEPWLLLVWWGANWSKKVPGHSWPGYLPPHPWPSWSNPSPPGTGCSVSSWLPWETPLQQRCRPHTDTCHSRRTFQQCARCIWRSVSPPWSALLSSRTIGNLSFTNVSTRDRIWLLSQSDSTTGSFKPKSSSIRFIVSRDAPYLTIQTPFQARHIFVSRMTTK